jgi:hypothetical protein
MVVYHRLINRNIETRQATCMVCGPVAVLRTGTKEKPQWVCAKYVRYFRLRKWGMSVDEYQRMLDAQGGLCAICKEEMGLPQIDHSHHGNMGIRELLCRDDAISHWVM